MNIEQDMVRSKLALISNDLDKLEPLDYLVDGDIVDMTLDSFAYLADLAGISYDEYLEKMDAHEWWKTISV